MGPVSLLRTGCFPFNLSSAWRCLLASSVSVMGRSVRLLHIQYALVRARMCAWCNIQMASLSLLSSIPLLLLDIDMPFMRVAIKHKISTPPIFVWLIFEALPLFSDADTFIFSAATHSFNHQKWYKYIFFKMLIPIYICIFGRNEFLISSGIIQLKK